MRENIAGSFVRLMFEIIPLFFRKINPHFDAKYV